MTREMPFAPDTIRALDDAALTALAVTLGLTHVARDPTTDVVQATALLRTLRTLGWHTHVATSPDGSGKVFVWRDLPDHGPRYGQAFGLEGEPTEARALVLCAVLATAHTAGGQGGTFHLEQPR